MPLREAIPFIEEAIRAAKSYSSVQGSRVKRSEAGTSVRDAESELSQREVQKLKALLSQFRLGDQEEDDDEE